MNSVQRQNHKIVQQAKDMVMISIAAKEPEWAYKFTKELAKKAKKVWGVT